jgi:hypothetical protein
MSIMNLPQGIDCRARAQEKREITLRWLNRWGYTTPNVLSHLLATPQGPEPLLGSRLITQLIKIGMVREVACGGNWGYWKLLRNARTGRRERQGPFLAMLTEAGKSTASGLDDAPGARWERQVSGIQIVRHNLICQQVVAMTLNTTRYVDYRPDSTLEVPSTVGQKRPDCVLTRSDGALLALEIELTPKQGTARDRSLTASLMMLKRGGVNGVLYLFASEQCAAGYRAIWESGRLPYWYRESGCWRQDGVTDIPEHLRSCAWFQQSDLLRGSLL